MTRTREIYQSFGGSLLAGCLLLMAACSDGQEPLADAASGGNLRLAAVTRTDGSTPLEEDGSQVRLFIASQDALVSSAGGTFIFSGGSWSSTASVKENSQYYLYGYLANTAGITVTASEPAEGDFSAGADLTFTGLPAITADDICVIVGVEQVDSKGAPWNVTEGSYGYLSKTDDQNYVNLLLDHLYSQLKLQFRVGDSYAGLREIHLKEVKLTATYAAGSATVSLRSGSGIGTPVYTIPTGNTEYDVLAASASEVILTTDAASAVLGTFCCIPDVFSSDGSTLKLTSTYDVYDRKGNKIAERTADNKLAVTGMARGKSRTLTLTVEPTYLYILSDDDLDNPSIIVSSE